MLIDINTEDYVCHHYLSNSDHSYICPNPFMLININFQINEFFRISQSSTKNYPQS